MRSMTAIALFLATTASTMVSVAFPAGDADLPPQPMPDWAIRFEGRALHHPTRPLLVPMMEGVHTTPPGHWIFLRPQAEVVEQAITEEFAPAIERLGAIEIPSGTSITLTAAGFSLVFSATAYSDGTLKVSATVAAPAQEPTMTASLHLFDDSTIVIQDRPADTPPSLFLVTVTARKTEPADTANP